MVCMHLVACHTKLAGSINTTMLGPHQSSSCTCTQPNVMGHGQHNWNQWKPLLLEACQSGEKTRRSFLGEEANWPIHHKELMATVLVLEIFCPKFQNHWIEVESNNTTVVAGVDLQGSPSGWRVVAGLETTTHHCKELVRLAHTKSTQCCYEHWWQEFTSFTGKVGARHCQPVRRQWGVSSPNWTSMAEAVACVWWWQ